jgi:TIR domain
MATEGPDPPARVFINYRRGDTQAEAGRLYDWLRHDWAQQGEHHVFKDIDSIRGGQDFREAIEDALDRADVVIALIGTRWLKVRDAKRRPRLEDPADWVRLELQRALERDDVVVIPVLVEGAEMPRVDEVPAALQALVYRHALMLTDARWKTDVEKLVREIDEAAVAREKEPRPEERVAEEIKPPPPPAHPPTPPAERHVPLVPVLWGIGALAAVIIAVVLLTRDSGAPPLIWEAVPDPDLNSTGTLAISALVRYEGDPSSNEPAFVAAGSHRPGPTSESDAAVWVADSPDGQEWDRITVEESPDLGGEGNQAIAGLEVVQGRRIVAVGTDGSDAAVWISDGGDIWTKVSDPDLEGVGTQAMIRLKDVAGLLVAVGSTTNGLGDTDGAVWTSADFGEDWQLVPTEGQVFGGDGNQIIERVQEIQDGSGISGLVAVGSDDGSGDTDGAVWLADATAGGWRRIEADELRGQGIQQIQDVGTIGTTLIAVGFEDAGSDEDGVVWTSENSGETWIRLDDEAFGGDGDQRIVRVIAPEQAVEGLPRIVAGGFETSGLDDDAVLWFSEDGRDWGRQEDGAEALGGYGNQRIATLFARGIPAIAVGTEGMDAAVWTAEPG